MKKIFSLFLVMVLVLSSLPVIADEATDGNGNSGEAADTSMVQEEVSVREKDNALEMRKKIENKADSLKTEARERIKGSEVRREAFTRIESKLSKVETRLKDKFKELQNDKLRRLNELDADKLKQIAGLDKVHFDKLAAVGRARLKELAKLDKSELVKKIGRLEIKKIKNVEELNKRRLKKEVKAKLEGEFEDADNEQHGLFENLEKTKERAKAAKETGNDETKLSAAKEHLAQVADIIIKHLEKLKLKAESSENLDEEIVNSIVERINAQITEVNSIKEKGNSASELSEIRAAIKELKDKWQAFKHIIKFHAELVVNARIRGLVNRGEVLEKRLDHLLAKAEEQGIAIDVDAEVAEFSAKLEEARTKFNEAEALLKTARELVNKGVAENREEIKRLNDSAKELLKSARDLMKEAHDILKDILDKIKDANKELDIDEDVEIEVVEEKIEVEGVES